MSAQNLQDGDGREVGKVHGGEAEKGVSDPGVLASHSKDFRSYLLYSGFPLSLLSLRISSEPPI